MPTPGNSGLSSAVSSSSSALAQGGSNPVSDLQAAAQISSLIANALGTQRTFTVTPNMTLVGMQGAYYSNLKKVQDANPGVIGDSISIALQAIEARIEPPHLVAQSQIVDRMIQANSAIYRFGVTFKSVDYNLPHYKDIAYWFADQMPLYGWSYETGLLFWGGTTPPIPASAGDIQQAINRQNNFIVDGVNNALKYFQIKLQVFAPTGTGSTGPNNPPANPNPVVGIVPQTSKVQPGIGWAAVLGGAYSLL